MNREEITTNMNMKTITITNDFICYQQGGIGKEIIIAIEEMKQENKQLKEIINKAIEYIEKEKFSYVPIKEKDLKICWSVVRTINLLEILKGDY